MALREPFLVCKKRGDPIFCQMLRGGGGGRVCENIWRQNGTLSGLENFLHLDFDIFRVKLPYVLLSCLLITSNLKLLRAS